MRVPCNCYIGRTYAYEGAMELLQRGYVRVWRVDVTVTSGSHTRMRVLCNSYIDPPYRLEIQQLTGKQVDGFGDHLRVLLTRRPPNKIPGRENKIEKFAGKT
jgi:hypothetical protein